jgi:hypothetical protein
MPPPAATDRPIRAWREEVASLLVAGILPTIGEGRPRLKQAGREGWE